MVHVSGYNVKFVENPPFETSCTICLDTLKKPMQVDSCGHRFCKDCIEEFRINRGEPMFCPNDNQEIKNIFDDKGMERMILNLKVECKNNDKGCVWTGELRQLEAHLENCEHRKVECIHCSEEYFFIEKEDHEEKCKKFPLMCENECGETIPQIDMDEHLREACQNAIYPCKYRMIGCQVKGTPLWLIQHMKNESENHLSQVIIKLDDVEKRLTNQAQKTIRNTRRFCMYVFTPLSCILLGYIFQQKYSITDLQNKLSQKNDSIIDLQNKLSQQNDSITELLNQNEMFEKQTIQLIKDVYKLKENQAFKFTIKEFKRKFYSEKQNYYEILSHPFSCLDGYRARLQVYLNGNLNGHGTHVSVYFQIMKGPSDDQLDWPFEGNVKLSVQGKLNKKIEEEFDSITLKLQKEIDESFQKPKSYENQGWGFPRYIKHDDIENYIKNDRLTITCHVERIN